MLHTGPKKHAVLGMLTAMVLAIPTLVGAQQGQITGTAVDASTRAPLSAVQVFLQGSTIGGLSSVQGTFTLQNVPVGQQTVVAQRLGYQTIRQVVTVAAGQAVTVSLQLAPAVLSLQEVVATGLIDPVEGARSPVTVARLSRDMMPVQVGASPMQSMAGRMPGVQVGVTSAAPGTESQIVLRSPTGIGGYTNPLIVVDGVVLGSGMAGVAGEDIESVEIIKGAAASSLYGSRAAAGVISITTKRGKDLTLGQTRFEARVEVGTQRPYRAMKLPNHTFYYVDQPGPDGKPTNWVNAAGAVVSRKARVAPPADHQFMVNNYLEGSTIFDNVNNMWGSGGTRQENYSMMSNGAETNFAVLVNRYIEDGVLLNSDGYVRNSVRINLDHRVSDQISLGVTGFQSRDEQDNITELGAGGLDNVYRAPRDVDILGRCTQAIVDEDAARVALPATDVNKINQPRCVKADIGNYLRLPDPLIPFENPLWYISSRPGETKRTRTLGGANMRWEPAYWVTFAGNVSMDREDSSKRLLVPKGLPTSATNATGLPGSINFDKATTDAINAEAQVSFRHDFGQLNVRSTVRGLIERNRKETSSAGGTTFFVGGVESINSTATKTAASNLEEVRSLGYLNDWAFDYGGKYIFSALVRRDGSSLFGPDDRWHWYYRTAAAWRIAEEPWFNIPQISELKLSYSRGTAGGRPPFVGQYESWSVTQSGATKTTLGNSHLAPQLTTENEVSMNLVLFNKTALNLTYAFQTTTDQIYPRALPAFTGYGNQYQNNGEVKGYTYEASLESSVRPWWTTQLSWDASIAQITKWGGLPYSQGYRIWGEDLPMYGISQQYNLQFWSDFENHYGGYLVPNRNEFELDEDGYIVWVGLNADGTPRHWWEGAGPDGIINTPTTPSSDDNWGKSKQFAKEKWYFGETMLWKDDTGTVMRMGSSNPKGDGIQPMRDTQDHMNFGWTNNFTRGHLGLNMNVYGSYKIKDGNMGCCVMRALWRTNDHAKDDQIGTGRKGKPQELWKSALYYSDRQAGTNNQQDNGRNDSLRIGSLALTYNFDAAELQRLGFGRIGLTGINGLTVGLVGRNLGMITDNFGGDPLRLVQLDGERTPGQGAGTTTVIDINQGYPSAATYSVEFDVTF